MLTRIDHVGIACDDLEAAVGLYESSFGLHVVAREVNEEQGVEEVMLRVADGPLGSSHVQLLRPLHPDTPVGKYLATRGPGLHHVAYGVDDATAALAELEGRGLRLIDRTPRHGAMGSSIGFLHPKAVGGVLTELVQAAPRD